jgi:hypothetical protein
LESTLSLCVINLTPSDPSGTPLAFCCRRAPERSVVTVAAKLIKRPVTTIFHPRRFNEFALEKFQVPFLFSLQRQFDWKTQFADGCLHFVSAREAVKIPALFAFGRMKLGFPLARAKLGSVSLLSHTGLIGLFWQAGVCIGKKSEVSGAPKICIQKAANYYHIKYSVQKTDVD